MSLAFARMALRLPGRHALPLTDRRPRGGRPEDGDRMTPSDRPAFAIPEGVLARQVDDEMVLLDLESEQYYGLDRVGADIVSRLTCEPEHEAVAALCRDYEVDDAILRTDVERLVAELLAAGLLTRVHPG